MHLLGHPRIEPVVNYTVLSEYTYYLLAIEGHKSPRSIKESGAISETLSLDNPESFLSIFSITPSSKEIIPVFLDMMSRYNLLPNDALILADCKLNNIDALASYDIKDFATACRLESVKLISSIAELSYP
ncbi:PIN domain-containing protein [Dyadobacter sp. OTU695]|uniref:PIN domain-containing protein n=1 Tax=Dyadobacter sp. OTU695 TaxID=3043860 RepID=UPI00313B9175